MLAQLPSNMILTRVRPSIYLPACVAVWSCVSAATSAAGSYKGLVTIRFFLGIVEAPFFPGVSGNKLALTSALQPGHIFTCTFSQAFYLLSCWYTRKELALRTAVLYSGLVLATAFSGLIAAGVFAGLDGARGIAGWQWLFIIEGAGSFFAAVIAIFLLPDYPESEKGSGAWLFSAYERKLAADRILLDRVSLPQSDRSVWVGLRLAVTDYRTWIFVSALGLPHGYGLVSLIVFVCVNTGSPSLLESHRIRLQQFLPHVRNHRPQLLTLVTPILLTAFQDFEGVRHWR